MNVNVNVNVHERGRRAGRGDLLVAELRGVSFRKGLRRVVPRDVETGRFSGALRNNGSKPHAEQGRTP